MNDHRKLTSPSVMARVRSSLGSSGVRSTESDDVVSIGRVLLKQYSSGVISREAVCSAALKANPLACHKGRHAWRLGQQRSGVHRPVTGLTCGWRDLYEETGHGVALT